MHATHVMLIAVLVACGEGTAPPGDPIVPVPDDGSSYWPAATWRVARPGAVDIDEAAVDDFVRNARRQLPALHALLVVRYGYLAVEEYAGGSSADQLHTMQSVSKSVTSLLMGIAADRGLVDSFDRPLLDFFPEYDDLANVDDRKRALTVRHVMQMRTGMSFWESPYEGSPLQQLNESQGDWLHLVLDRPMDGDPGATWAYNSGGVITLGGVLRAATGLAADQFADRELFSPIGITTFSWFKGNPNGLPHMGGGLSLRAPDLARIGYLVLRRGVWAGDTIVSPARLDELTRRVTTATARYFPRDTDYGMLWWLFPRNGVTGAGSGDDYIVAASGTGGQWLFIDRAHDLLVVFTASLNSGSWPAVQLLFDALLPAVHPRSASPG